MLINCSRLNSESFVAVVGESLAFALLPARTITSRSAHPRKMQDVWAGVWKRRSLLTKCMSFPCIIVKNGFILKVNAAAEKIRDIRMIRRYFQLYE
jgi:hypothetical protein